MAHGQQRSHLSIYFKVKVNSCQAFVSSIKTAKWKKIGTEEKDRLKIAPDPVTSEGVTAGKTHQGDNAVPLGFACTHSHFRKGRWQIQSTQVLCFAMTRRTKVSFIHLP